MRAESFFEMKNCMSSRKTKKKEIKVEAIAWKTSSKEESEVSFCLQVNGVTRKNKNKIKRALNGWRISGEGHDIRGNRTILLCYREFEDKNQFVEWARAFPYTVFEERRTGKLRKIVSKRTKSGKK